MPTTSELLWVPADREPEAPWVRSTLLRIFPIVLIVLSMLAFGAP